MKGKIALNLVTVFALAMSLSAATLPAGTNVTVRTGATLSSKTARAGRTIPCSVARDVVVHGEKLAKVGDPAKCRVTGVKHSGRLHAPGLLSIRLAEVNGQPVATGSHTFKGKSNVTKIGGGAAAGALIGGLAGGGKGALIGTAAGGAAGTGVAVATGKEEVVVPAETAMTFTIHGATKQNR
jgi:hypothetical protein